MSLKGAHVRKRKNQGKSGHAWQIIVELSPCPETGKRRRVYKTVRTTLKEAERIMREMVAELETDSYLKDTTIGVEKFMREWHSTYIVPFKSPVTSETYLYNLEKYILPAFGRLRLQELTTIKIQQWVNSLGVSSPLSDKPLHAKTIRNLYMNLNAALKKAVLLEYLKKNPAATVELPRCANYKAQVYDSTELGTLIEAVKGTELELGVMILITLGIRRGELMALLWSDIDFDNNVVRITKSRVKIKRKQSVTKSPKSESGNRNIDAPPILMELLRREKAAYAERKAQYGAEFHDNNLVVCQPNGKSYEPDYFTHKFRQFVKAQGLKKIRLHDLRHSNATFMLKMGISAKVMQKRLGHSSYTTTMNIYAHSLDELGKEAADTLNKGLESVMAKAL